MCLSVFPADPDPKSLEKVAEAIHKFMKPCKHKQKLNIVACRSYIGAKIFKRLVFGVFGPHTVCGKMDIITADDNDAKTFYTNILSRPTVSLCINQYSGFPPSGKVREFYFFHAFGSPPLVIMPP